MKKSWIISLGAGYSQLPLIMEARALGYRVAAVDRDPSAIGFLFADRAVECSTHDTARLLDLIVAEDWEVQGVLARTTGQALWTAAALVEKFGLPGPSRQLAELGTSKQALKSFLIAHGLRTPLGRVCNAEELPKEDEIPYPRIVKPDFTCVGKADIRIARNQEQCREFLPLAATNSGNGQALIEQFIEGHDVSFLIWLHRGKASLLLSWDEINGFDSTGAVGAIGLVMPSSAAECGHEEAIFCEISALATHFPQDSVILALSYRIDESGLPWLIEMHADLTGDLILDVLARRSTHQNVISALVKLQLSGDPSAFGDLTMTPSALLHKNPSQQITGRSAKDLRLQILGGHLDAQA